jgi:hypothetical protein
VTFQYADSWNDPFWGKPYGLLSEAREQNAVIGTAWENLTTRALKVVSDPAQRVLLFKRSEKSALFTQPRLDCARQDVVKLKKYAHERLVLSSYWQTPRYKKSKSSLDNLSRGLSWVRELDVLRESRQAIEIGGRFRKKPLATKFTTNGKNIVRDGAYISEHQTEGDGYFLTLTFPGGTDEGFAVMGLASGYAVDRVNRWLRYRVHRGVFSYVWELQKRGAPHLHYLFRVPFGTVQADFLREVKQRWYQILLDICEDSQTDLFERKKGGTWLDRPEVLQVDIKPIHDGYSKYLSKYLSKTCSKSGAQTKWFPGRWWGVSAPARKLIFAARLEVVLPVRHAPTSYRYIKQWVNTIGDLVQDSFSFPRIPKGEHDGLSVQPLVGFGTKIFEALRDVFQWGDFQPTFDLIGQSRDWCVLGPHVWRINYHDCS